MTLWGSGTPRREFLHTADVAAATDHLLKNYDDVGPINVGCGSDVTIRELAALVAEVVGFEGDVQWDATKPDGTPRKLLDVSRLSALGWQAQIGLRQGISETYAWYLESAKSD